MKNRRNFLKKALKVSALGGVVASVPLYANTQKASDGSSNNGVVVGRARKKEILYKKTQHWDKFYKVAY